MSLKVYGPLWSFRTQKCLIAAKIAGVHADHVEVALSEAHNPEHLKRNPQGKVPVLETPEGFVFESNAILRYFANTSKVQGLYGSNEYQQAIVDQWLDFTGTEIEGKVMAVIAPILGFIAYDEVAVKAAIQVLDEKLKIVDAVLKNSKYLVGDHITIADIALSLPFLWLFRTAYAEGKRKSICSHVEKWIQTLVANPDYHLFTGKAQFVKSPIQSLKPEKKEEKQPEKKEEKKVEKKVEKKEKKQEEDDEEDKPKKVEKNPLDSLPPTTFNMDDWKRRFVNSTNKAAEMDWFYANLDVHGYSIWKLYYEKAEGEGKMMIKTNNTCKGFIQRTDQDFRKYAFAMHGVYGDEPNLEIRGLWMWRGQEIPLEMKDHPSFEFHKLFKLDITKEADRKVINEYWLNQTEDESVVEGLTARTLVYFK